MRRAQWRNDGPAVTESQRETQVEASAGSEMLRRKLPSLPGAAACSYADCTGRWRSIGLRIVFYNLGGRNPCLRQYGYFSNATMVGRHWITARGLRLGDPARKLYVLYSPRRFTGAWAWLLTRWSPFGDGAYYAGLAAKIRDGWVTAFRIRYAAGGD
jgi:hypothetical protein